MFIYVYSVVSLEVSTIFANFGGLDSTSRASKRSSIHSSPWLSWWLTILKSLDGGHENPKTLCKNGLSLQQNEGTKCWDRATWTFCSRKVFFHVKSSRSNIWLKLPSLLLICGAIIKITLGSLLGKQVSLVTNPIHFPIYGWVHLEAIFLVLFFDHLPSSCFGTPIKESVYFALSMFWLHTEPWRPAMQNLKDSMVFPSPSTMRMTWPEAKSIRRILHINRLLLDINPRLWTF